MSDEPQSSDYSSDERFRRALGKIDQYRILEGLYKKVREEKRDLERKLSTLQQRRNEESPGGQSRTESPMRRSISITREILDVAQTQQLDHPTEFYEVMEKEKNEEIELLTKKAADAEGDLKKVQRERDELSGQILQLMTAMREKDGCMKELERRVEEVLTEDERHNCLEREQVLRELVQRDAGSSWVVVTPGKDPPGNVERREEETTTRDTVELRSKVDELQRRITELLNHNEKWNTLCEELQVELDRVKGQLLLYQKAEGSVKVNLCEDLKLEMKRRIYAEEMSARARKQVEELEAKVAQLEKELEDKERQEREMSMVAEDLREKAMLYEEQIRSYKEDFENEQRDHNVTRSQLDSLKSQWTTIYKDLQAKTEQLRAMVLRMETQEHNNKELQKQLEQARRDAQLIREHQEQQQQLSRTPSTEDTFWECPRCTYHNLETAFVCKMCANARHQPISQLSEPSPSRGRPSTGRDVYDKRSFGTAPEIGVLEEDGIACF